MSPCERPSGVHRDLVAKMPALGWGSYGSCLAVDDKMTGERFCLKVPRPGDDRAETSVKHEFRILAQMTHTNVMRAEAFVVQPRTKPCTLYTMLTVGECSKAKAVLSPGAAAVASESNPKAPIGCSRALTLTLNLSISISINLNLTLKLNPNRLFAA